MNTAVATTQSRTVGLLGLAPDLARSCAQALTGVGDPVPVSHQAVRDGLKLDLLIMAVSVQDGIKTFWRIHEAQADLPVVLLGATDVTADLAVELVKCGAADFLTWPVDRGILRQKIERTLEMRSGAVALSPALAAVISPTAPEHDGKNRRNSFRARVPKKLATAVLIRGRTTAEGTLVDLSVAANDAPGGMLVRADAATARRLGMGGWVKGNRVDMSVKLPDGGPPIPVITRVIRTFDGAKSGTGGHRVALQYRPAEARDTNRLQRFWVLCQRGSR